MDFPRFGKSMAWGEQKAKHGDCQVRIACTDKGGERRDGGQEQWCRDPSNTLDARFALILLLSG
jgi:hypothetical protein